VITAGRDPRLRQVHELGEIAETQKFRFAGR